MTDHREWITNRPPTEYDIDLFDCIAIPTPAGRKSKSMSVSIDLYREGTPWHHTTKRRKNKFRKSKTVKQSSLFQRSPCVTCSYYDNGVCRRRAPVAQVLPAQGGEWVLGWPTVAETDWCGEWEAQP